MKQKHLKSIRIAVAAVMFAGRMLWRYTLFNASQRIEAGLRREMFEKSERP